MNSSEIIEPGSHKAAVIALMKRSRIYRELEEARKISEAASANAGLGPTNLDLQFQRQAMDNQFRWERAWSEEQRANGLDDLRRAERESQLQSIRDRLAASEDRLIITKKEK